MPKIRRKRFTPEEYNQMKKNKKEVPVNLLKHNFFTLESNRTNVEFWIFIEGGSTTPQNGEVKALSVSVPWLDVFTAREPVRMLAGAQATTRYAGAW